MENEVYLDEVLQENNNDIVLVSSVSQDDFYNFNNNFVVLASFLSISLGIIGGLILGHIFNGIFTD